MQKVVAILLVNCVWRSGHGLCFFISTSSLNFVSLKLYETCHTKQQALIRTKETGCSCITFMSSSTSNPSKTRMYWWTVEFPQQASFLVTWTQKLTGKRNPFLIEIVPMNYLSHMTSASMGFHSNLWVRFVWRKWKTHWEYSFWSSSELAANDWGRILIQIIWCLTLSLPKVPLALKDFTMSNTRRFYSSSGNPLGVKGLQSKKHLPIILGKK